MSDKKELLQPVVVRDFEMPFSSMITFMVKWAFAAIPAMVILAIVLGLIYSVFLASCASMK